MQDGLISERVPITSKKVVITALLGVVALCGAVLFLTQGNSAANDAVLKFKLAVMGEPVEPFILESFKKWQQKFNVQYKSNEEFHKIQVFRQNYFRVKSMIEKGKKSFTVGLTKFMDLTAAEFRAFYLSTRRNTSRVRNPVFLDTENLPDKIDWRDHGAVTPVKDQGQCGSCWAFSATGSMEGANFIKNGQLLSFSEQQYVDCSWDQGNEGCNGGLMDSAFEYSQVNGLELESDYPYKARDMDCKFDPTKVKFMNTGYKDVPTNNEDQLAAAVAAQPVSVAIEADQDVFQFYTGGVLDSDECGTDLDHGVLAVGYDTTAPKPYWIVKNSWGQNWGEHGYVRIAKGSSGPGICGIAEDASYATA